MPKKDFLKRLSDGDVIICAEGYLIEFERRGFLQAGGFFPEVVLEKPEIVEQLHEEFIHAGSDVVVAFTFYGHRNKLRQLGRESDVEKLNRTALRIAKRSAEKHGCLVAGNICSTGLFLPKDYDDIRSMFEEQVKWAKEEGVDFIIAETFKGLDEASLALKVVKEAGIPAAVMITPYASDKTFDGVYIPEALRQLEEQGAALVGMNCGRGPKSMLPLIEDVKNACKGPIGAVPVVYRTSDQVKCWQGLKDPDTGAPSYPFDLQCHQCNRSEIRDFGEQAKKAGVQYIGLCCGNSSFYLREVAEAYGRTPAASKYKPSMEHSMYFADEDKMSEDRLKMKHFILGE